MARSRLCAVLACAVVAAGCATKATASDDSAPRASRTATNQPASTTTTTIDRRAPARVGDIAVSEIAPPMLAPPAQWLRLQRPDGVVQLAAVYRPAARGRHPVVVYLHGSSGLGVSSLQWSQRLADAGFVVVTGCYLDPYPSPRRLSCPTEQRDEPEVPEENRRSYRTLIDVATALPDVYPERLGVVGVSWGAIMALSLEEPRVRAIVADSGYGRNGPHVTDAPIFLIGMEVDSHVLHSKVLNFEAALAFAGKQPTTHYYPGTGHVATLEAPPIKDDATRRTIAFLREHL